MNNKLIIPAVTIIAVLGIVGFILFKNSQGNNNVAGDSKSGGDSMMEMSEVGKMFAKAFQGNSSIKCVYSQDGVKSTSYIKRGMIRVDTKGSGEGQDSSMIFKDPIVYSWQVGSSDGFMMDTSKKTDVDESEGAETQQPFQNPDEIKAQIEKNAPKCNEENISDSMFVPPTDVNFKSMDQMMEGMPEGMELPEGIELPEGFQLPQGQ